MESQMIPCAYPTCENTFTGGPKNRKYCHGCGRHRWKLALANYNKIVIEGGTEYQNMIAREWDEKCAGEAAGTPRAGAGERLSNG